jgi:hypothetical protein
MIATKTEAHMVIGEALPESWIAEVASQHAVLQFPWQAVSGVIPDLFCLPSPHV